MTRYIMRARSQGALYIQRTMAHCAEKDIHRWAFAHSMDPGVEFTVRKWLCQRLNGFYCDLQAAYVPRCSSATGAESDEITPVGLQGLSSLDVVKALIKATGLNPHLSVCGWPFCLDDLDGVNDVDNMEGGVQAMPVAHSRRTSPHLQSKRKTEDGRSDR